MTRLMDRTKLNLHISNLKELVGYMNEGEFVDFIDEVKEIIRFLEWLKTLKVLNEESMWIDCTCFYCQPHRGEHWRKKGKDK